MKKSTQTIIALLFVLILSGCATNVRTYPQPITTLIEQKHDGVITILISEKDLNREELISFGIVGLLFPLKVHAGEMLRASATSCFDRLFDKTTFGEANSGNTVALAFEESVFYL